MTLGERLKSVRIENEKTQQEVADFLGITQGGVGHYEADRHEPSLETLKKLSDYFGCSFTWLIQGKHNDEQNVEFDSKQRTNMQNYVEAIIELSVKNESLEDENKMLKSTIKEMAEVISFYLK